MKIAITGSSGFIGSALMSSLKGHEILKISRSENLDITNWEEVRNLPHFDVIVHLAAKTFVPDSFNNPHSFYEVNLRSTINALEVARERKARLIYMSSYLYGPPQYLPVDEKHPLVPHNPYAQTKILGEQLCEGYSRDFNIPITVLRLFNIYGPGQKEPFLIPTILEQAKQGSIILKDPRPKRDFIHVSEVVDAVVKSINSCHKKLRVFNLRSGRSYSVEEVVDVITKQMNNEIKVSYLHEYRKGEVMDSVADISKIKSELQWEPSLSLEDGIADCLAGEKIL